jgi:ABC-2 type transport system permease protein
MPRGIRFSHVGRITRLPTGTGPAGLASTMMSVMSYADSHPFSRTPWAGYRHSLWLLTSRDLKVRYSTSALGYLWSILDPLVMAGIYWFVFTQVFQRPVGTEPYIVFLLSALLPWMWFNGAISDSTRAFLKDAKLVRSTKLPRTIWVNRIVLSKGIEFLLSLPVLALFAIVFRAEVDWGVLWFPLAIVLQTMLTAGVGLVIAPLVVFFRDLERATKLVLRFLFYASPIVYGTSNLPEQLHFWAAFNPLTGIFGLYRSAFFPEELDWFAVGVAAAMSVAILALGLWVFRNSERQVLKEI